MIDKRGIILKQVFGGGDTGLTDEQKSKIKEAMNLFALRKIEEYRNRELKGEVKTFFKLLMNFSYDNSLLWGRYQILKRAIKKARRRANIENRKCYVIREANLKYKVLSTLDVDYNKKIRVMNKDVDFRKLHEVSDFIAYPKKK